MVRDQAPDDSIRPGDRVAVPWGLDVLEGTVVSTEGGGPGRRVVVSVDLPDTEESGAQLVTFPASELEAAAAVASERQPGAWLPAFRYEEALRHALEYLIQADAELGIQSLGHERPSPDSRADFALDVGDHRLIIEAKSQPSGQVACLACQSI